MKTKREFDEDGEFVKSVLTLDETSAVLKGHLKLEQVLDEALKELTVNPEKIMKWSFADKVEILYALGLFNKTNVGNYRKINSLRNSFSHKYNYHLSKEDFTFLKSLISKDRIKEVKTLETEGLRRISLITCAIAYLSGFVHGRLDSLRNT